MLPEDVLGVVAAFFMARERDMRNFAAVSWSWTRALAAAEDIWGPIQHRRAAGETLVNPAVDRDMWMCDVDDIGGQYSTVHAGERHSSFISRAVIGERAAVSQRVEWLEVKWEHGRDGLHCFEKVVEQIAPADLKVLSVTTADMTHEDKLWPERIAEVLVRLTGLESLRIAVHMSGLAIDNALRASAETLKILHIPSHAVKSEVLKELPNLRVVWVCDATDQELDAAVQPDLYLPNINELHRLEELRLQGKRRCIDSTGMNWPAMLPGLTNLRTLEVNDKFHEPDMSLDGMGCGESLTFLNMSWVCDVTTPTVKSIVANFPNLKVLHLTMCTDIDTEGYAALGSLQHLERLELWEAEINFAALNALRSAKSLQLLSASGMNAEDMDPSVGFLDVFASFPALTALEMGDSAMPNGPAVSQLVEALPCCPKLQFLDLAKMGHRRTDPTYAPDSVYDLDTEALAHLVNLRSLDIAGTKATPRTQQSLAKLHNLEDLRMGHGVVSGSALIETAKSNGSSLRNLSLNHVESGITAKEFVAVGVAARCLQKVDLSFDEEIFWVDFSDQIAAARKAHQRPFLGLALLYLGTSERLQDQDLVAWCVNCPNLKKIDASNCLSLTSACLPAVAKLRLTSLDMSECSIHSLDVLEQLLSGNQDLEHVITTHDKDFKPAMTAPHEVQRKRVRIATLVERLPSLESIRMDDALDGFKIELQQKRKHLR